MKKNKKNRTWLKAMLYGLMGVFLAVGVWYGIGPDLIAL